ncbi:MAG: hypothetical protein HRT45_03970 [Bdellovibrionales bacterium]|nr:hypothetical protein [Bdellovibrionales bacterium]
MGFYHLSKLAQDEERYPDLKQVSILLKSVLPKGYRDPLLTTNDPRLLRYRPVSRAFFLELGQDHFNEISRHFFWGPYSETARVKDLYQQVTPELIVAVHAKRLEFRDFPNLRRLGPRMGFVERLNDDFFDKPENLSLPRVLLTQRDYPIQDRSLIERASLVIYSQAGELPREFPTAEVYHLVGEEFDRCVNSTVPQLAALASRSDLQQVEFRFHQDFLLQSQGQLPDGRFERIVKLTDWRALDPAGFNKAIEELALAVAKGFSGSGEVAAMNPAYELRVAGADEFVISVLNGEFEVVLKFE